MGEKLYNAAEWGSMAGTRTANAGAGDILLRLLLDN